MTEAPEQELAAWVQYLRDMGIYDLYGSPSPVHVLPPEALERLRASLARPGAVPQAAETPRSTTAASSPGHAGTSSAGPPRPAPPGGISSQPPAARAGRAPVDVPVPAPQRQVPAASAPEPSRAYFNTESEGTQTLPPELAAPMPRPNPLETLFPAPVPPVPPAERADALARLQAEIGDCTRCPLAYAGRHTVVFGEGDPNAALMFVGEGPGADEDTSGRPFVGKAGQLLNNMIGAMGLAREQVFIANIVKCRPPGNRTPEFVEATTCSQFLLRQIDIVRPQIIVALGSTAATYLLGVRQSLASLRGQWFASRGAKVAVTFHPAFLLRDPRQKAEAWKDLQRVMAELGLKGAPAKKA
jgi:uracil-DNA glycosylase